MEAITLSDNVTSGAQAGPGVATKSDQGGVSAYWSPAWQADQQVRLLSEIAQKQSRFIATTHSEAIQSRVGEMEALMPALLTPAATEALNEYVQDSWQRWILFLDILRERGNSYVTREKEGFKPVLAFAYDMILDGRKRERPVNYALVRIDPPEGYPPRRESGRPFVIIDPRAGHGSGIGGFKAESEVGVALKDGHPVYFVIFFPNPEEGQTLSDVCAAEAAFLEEVQRRHPSAPAPLVIGNCQGGWASMILAATHPDLTGPVVIAGAPLSYWSGEVGKNPLRYLGGLAGGAVPALLASDLGGGKFDGAGLVLNFETLNPGKTWWRKYYDVYSGVDSKGGDFLEFERWWSGFYFMNEAEIRWIVENLFIGNKLTRGQAVLTDGTPVDLKRIKQPVIVFASHGDNITPPQQALNWIPDLYESVEEIRARGRVIIYTLHDSIGHLGIFVSAKVASKQHKQITSVVKTIEALAPGLYELLIKGQDGSYEVSFEARSIDDILKLDDGRGEEIEFAAVARLSEWATKTYELMMRPAIRSFVSQEVAEAVVKVHPIRQRSYMFSDENPLMTGIGELAHGIRQNRRPASCENPFVKLERLHADAIEQGWNLFRDVRDAMMEFAFHSIYATPWMKAIASDVPHRDVIHDLTKLPEVREAVARTGDGGFSEAVVRMLILLARARGSVRRDRLERSNRILHSRAPFDSMSEVERTRIINEQNLIVQFAPDAAVSSLPRLLRDEVDRIRAVNLVFDIAGPADEMDAHTIAMFKRLQAVLMTMAWDWREPRYEVRGEAAAEMADTAAKASRVAGSDTEGGAA
jgi:pimeloyl-ACP methyl ester carboxylesterase